MSALGCAVVTGAASGIGAAVLRCFAGAGNPVLGVDVDDSGRRLAADLAASGAEATWITGDVAVEETWQRVAERTPRMHVLVSNAYAVAVKPLHETAPEEWRRQLAVNLDAAYLGFRACLPALRAGGGSVVLVSSVHAHAGIPGHAAYAASKGALLSLTGQLAVDYGPGIRVNCVLPGPIATAAWDRVDAEGRERSAASTVMGRLGEPAEVAAAVHFLASAQASYITGSSLVVDGGWTVRKDSA
ncbi:NAD(P)-dependent dehydrogenase (short-subunit alcohol dehydrogenase family) [Saccharopolyspora erythraea NRRL 2338]|uniref:Short-chain dehydrogenase/reductase SDR n=2 Tax=Saccharopolyspora erythraea TaxID=1836 RepID=A4FK29_SACEN|nr:SDR family NAD(P)-dependent oxidoreductase [Saccharopolyspora erythraea]EQD86980.1 cyclopentanol dehydrogenase [Saccharopolyspora erythraea D]PFG98043.1 NAD(P)-dependent dehydrogenase (short-subunit alcohol dehydrogenase family) [Saccharopolyspora erythraea NRRL 2338]QRK88159.1 SDR family oxidoreductase [Saccharopolyspora erythraea]CAM04404.1 short-chain dehydrogenase/reductase SDR [Saccharopolyspora erythraea NRRL 2338]